MWERAGPLLLFCSVWWLVNSKTARGVFSLKTQGAEMMGFPMLIHPFNQQPSSFTSCAQSQKYYWMVKNNFLTCIKPF